jgi:hypothetical protein
MDQLPNPDLEKIFDWVIKFDVKPLEMNGFSKENMILANEIYSKFEMFRTWSLKQLTK